MNSFIFNVVISNKTKILFSKKDEGEKDRWEKKMNGGG